MCAKENTRSVLQSGSWYNNTPHHFCSILCDECLFWLETVYETDHSIHLQIVMLTGETLFCHRLVMLQVAVIPSFHRSVFRHSVNMFLLLPVP
mmetsp:Transcript_4074/g.7431  ORF Transcript_4074/g.7431 Transcript_4074/m.7431 type:complete len:93 (-) Transcript_4074:330-608(-)